MIPPALSFGKREQSAESFHMKFSIVIATYNRADELPNTLKSLTEQRVSDTWEVIVVDNNSSDATREVVLEAARNFPVDLRYVLEKEQGRSAALNAGIKIARGEIIAVTDDDVRVDPSWLNNSAVALDSLGCDYVGGKALPIWGGPRPDWLPDRGGKHWGVIALLDYGPEPIEFGNRVPLGVNMVFRRECFERAGLWDNSIGRKAGTLLGQEVREWAQRGRAAGLRGFYSPDLIVHHVISQDRLTKILSQVVLLARNQSRDSLSQQPARYGIAGKHGAGFFHCSAHRGRSALSLSHQH